MGRAPIRNATFDDRAMIAANSALKVITAAAQRLPRASVRQVEMFLTIATREPVDRRTLQQAFGNRKAVLDDLLQLDATSRDGKPGLGLILSRPKPRDSRRVQYALTPRGRRVARQITTAIEALEDAGGNEVAQVVSHENGLSTSGPVGYAEDAPVAVAPAPYLTVEIDEPEAPIEPPPPPRRPQVNPPQRRMVDRGLTRSLPKFRYKGTSIRAVQIDGVPWFVALDVCQCLGRDTSAGAAKALRYIAPDDRCVLVHTGLPPGFLGYRCYEASGISLSGFLKLIRRTKGPSARAFEQWVHDRVIPRLPGEGPR